MKLRFHQSWSQWDRMPSFWAFLNRLAAFKSLRFDTEGSRWFYSFHFWGSILKGVGTWFDNMGCWPLQVPGYQRVGLRTHVRKPCRGWLLHIQRQCEARRRREWWRQLWGSMGEWTEDPITLEEFIALFTCILALIFIGQIFPTCASKNYHIEKHFGPIVSWRNPSRPF